MPPLAEAVIDDGLWCAGLAIIFPDCLGDKDVRSH